MVLRISKGRRAPPIAAGLSTAITISLQRVRWERAAVVGRCAFVPGERDAASSEVLRRPRGSVVVELLVHARPEAPGLAEAVCGAFAAELGLEVARVDLLPAHAGAGRIGVPAACAADCAAAGAAG